MRFNSDGSCTKYSAAAPVALAQANAYDPPNDPACNTDIFDMGSFSSYYDPASEQVFISVTLPDKSYAGWGWGSSMTNTEMIIFSADG